MRFIQWLAKKIEKKPERDIDEKSRPLSKSPLAEKMNEIEIENGVVIVVDEPKKEFLHEETGKTYKTERALKAAITRFNKKKKFIDEVTGKEYKTERALKAGITRRLNKAKK